MINDNAMIRRSSPFYKSGTIIKSRVSTDVLDSTIIAAYQGLTWDESKDKYARTGALTGVPPSQAAPNYLLPIQSAMKRCVINDAGVVQYYLDPTDSTLREAGGASDLTGADGQVMVEIPAFYYKYGYSGTFHTWEISEYPLTGYSLHPAFIKNGVNVSHRYIGAYEATLYDVSASIYTNGIYHYRIYRT